MTNAVNLASAAGTGFAFRNRIINGAMEIDQRNAGAAVTVATSSWTYTLDRWRAYTVSGSAGSASISRVATTDFPETAYYLRYNQTVATTAGSPYLTQPIEDIRGFNGVTVTLSFKARVASGSINVTSIIAKVYGTSGSTTEFQSQNNTVTTSWQTFRHTVTLSSNASKTIGANSYLDIEFGLPAAATFDFHITDVQLEEGSAATPFERRPYGLELALCQRYFEKSYDIDVAPGGQTTLGAPRLRVSAPDFWYSVQFKVLKRAAPTCVIYSNRVTNAAGYIYQVDGTGSPADRAASVSSQSMSGFQFYCGTLTAAGNLVEWQWSASAEL